MSAPGTDRERGVRGRRLASYLTDIGFLFAPWAAVGGMAAAPGGGNAESGLAAFAALTFFCALASVAMLTLEVVLFVSNGRTLGMAVMGIHAEGGIKWLSMLLDPILATMSLVVAYLARVVLVGTDVMADDVASAIVPLVPLVVLGANFAFLLLPSRRTLTDMICRLRVVRDGPPAPSPPAGRRAAYIADAVVVAACGAPSLSVVGGSQLVTAALASALVLAVVGVLEISLWTRARATLGMRALGMRVVA